MNFDRFIQAARKICTKRKIQWDFAVDLNGRATGSDVWDLDSIAGAPRSPKGVLRDLGVDRRAAGMLAALGRPLALEAGSGRLSDDWMDLIKSVAIDWIAVRKNRPGTVQDKRLRPIRVLATCAGETPPWELDVEQVRQALGVGLALGVNVRTSLETVVARLFDLERLSNNSPLLSLALGGARRTFADKADLLSSLEERKAANKLPELRAFWELVRIVFTERPKTFTDALRFDHCKLLICTGFRVGESCLIPADWRRERQVRTRDNRSMEDVGGVGRFVYVRNFAEKQRGENEDSVVLYESTQYIPEMFSEVLHEALDGVLKRTAPLRDRLRLQVETGRLFPEFQPNELVPVREFYPRLSGNLRVVDDELPEDLVDRYRETMDPRVLDELLRMQQRPAGRFRKEVVKYFYQFGNRAFGGSGRAFPVRRADGSRWRSPISWVDAYVRVGELEEVVRQAMPRKLPDVTPYRLSNGSLLHSYDLLFLAPKASISEQRNGNLLDVNRYFAVGTVVGADLAGSLGHDSTNLFSRYGQTEADRSLTLSRTHSFRHLQNTELFRANLADAIISKRFNRRSVNQNDVYDHRNLLERLASIDLPSGTIGKLPAKARQTFQVINSGMAAGVIVDEFKRIQEADGEDAALDYLAVEADGFHVTPYGYCLNSFTVDPCPKHLECFNGCRHFGISKEGVHRSNLLKMEGQLSTALSVIEERAVRSIGRENQLADVRRKLANIRSALETSAGRPFSGGHDLFVSVSGSRTILDD